MHITHFSRGTTCYRAPELVKEVAKYTNKVDIFALGCILFELATEGKRAFANDFAVHDYSVSRSQIVLDVGRIAEESKAEVLSVVHKTLAIEPSSRPSAQQLCAEFEFEKFRTQAQECSRVNNHRAAIYFLNICVEWNPTDGDLWRALGDSYRKIDNYDETIKSYRNAIDRGIHESNIYLHLGDSLYTLGKYCAAIDAYTFGLSRHPSDIIFLQRAAKCSLSMLDYDNAIQMFQTAIKHDPADSTLLEILAKIYVAKRDFNMAVVVYKKALKAHPSTFAKDTIPEEMIRLVEKTAGKWYSLIGGKRRQDPGPMLNRNDLERQIILSETVVKAKKKLLGERHENTLLEIANLAGLQEAHRRLDELKTPLEPIGLGQHRGNSLHAIKTPKRGTVIETRNVTLGEDLAIDVVALGGEHQDILQASDDLSSTYWHQAQSEEAAVIQQKRLSTPHASQTDRHRAKLKAMENLAVKHGEQKRFNDAIRLGETLVAVRKELFGERHPDTVKSMHNLAASYRGQKRFEESVALEEAVVAARRETLGEQHWDTLNAMTALADTYRKQGRLDESVELLTPTLATLMNVGGERDVRTLRAMEILSLAYYDQGRGYEAAMLSERVLEGTKAVLGEQHPKTRTAVANLSLIKANYFAT